MKNNKTTTWSHLGTGEKEEVIIGSNRESELLQKMHDIGLWNADDPNKPEGCITFEEYLDSRKHLTLEDKYEEYKIWKANKILKDGK